jgi:hypothetical protein
MLGLASSNRSEGYLCLRRFRMLGLASSNRSEGYFGDRGTRRGLLRVFAFSSFVSFFMTRELVQWGSILEKARIYGCFSLFMEHPSIPHS